MPADAAPAFIVVSDLPGAGARVTLSAEESHYLTRVCRARPGDQVTGTDGRGALAALTLLAGGARAVAEVRSCERSLRARTAWVLAGPPEGERGDWLVEKLAELGVAVFQPLDCERGGWERAKGRSERWRRLTVAALRQSRRRFLLEVRPALPFQEVLARLPTEAGRWVGDLAGAPAAELAPPRQGTAAGVIGPAAGLSPRESASAAALGFVPIALSDSRLRAETAAMAWACWWAGGVPVAARGRGAHGRP